MYVNTKIKTKFAIICIVSVSMLTGCGLPFTQSQQETLSSYAAYGADQIENSTTEDQAILLEMNQVIQGKETAVQFEIDVNNAKTVQEKYLNIIENEPVPSGGALVSKDFLTIIQSRIDFYNLILNNAQNETSSTLKPLWQTHQTEDANLLTMMLSDVNAQLKTSGAAPLKKW